MLWETWKFRQHKVTQDWQVAVITAACRCVENRHFHSATILTEGPVGFVGISNGICPLALPPSATQGSLSLWSRTVVSSEHVLQSASLHTWHDSFVPLRFFSFNPRVLLETPWWVMFEKTLRLIWSLLSFFSQFHQRLDFNYCRKVIGHDAC